MTAYRRRLILAGMASFALPAVALARQCRITPRDALGPYYKSGAPEQADICASGSGGGQRLIVSGGVLGMPDCAPLPGALVEVWQADERGDYTGINSGRQDDPGCLLRASIRAGKDGRYSFATVFPGEYPGRPRHIHFRISSKGYATLVTQLYFGRERGIPEQLVVAVKRDDKDVLQANFDIALARAAGG